MSVPASPVPLANAANFGTMEIEDFKWVLAANRFLGKYLLCSTPNSGWAQGKSHMRTRAVGAVGTIRQTRLKVPRDTPSN